MLTKVAVIGISLSTLIWNINLQAADQVVSNLNDSGAGSLRQAVADVGTGENITFSVSGTINLASEIRIEKDLTIDGGSSITIDGGAACRAFNLDEDPRDDASFKTVNIQNITITDCNNTANYYAGAIYNREDLTLTNVTITNSSVVNNTTAWGGAIYSTVAAGSLTLNGCIISGCSATGSSTTVGNIAGGGIYAYNGTINITNTTITGCSAKAGGGMYSRRGNLTISSSTIKENTALYRGGGLSVIPDNTSPDIEITDSFIYKNMLTHDVGGSNQAFGGGIYATSGSSQTTTLETFNTTVTENQVNYTSGTGFCGGGGICFEQDGTTTITLYNSTISQNSSSNTVTATSSYGGGVYVKIGTLHAYSSLFADNATTGAGGIDINKGGSGTMGTVEYSLIEDGTKGNHGIVDGVDNCIVGDPSLSSAADNGGLTWTCALQADSLAIDTGSNPQSLTTDQRGGSFNRVYSGTADIGAYEFQYYHDADTNKNEAITKAESDTVKTLYNSNGYYRNTGTAQNPVFEATTYANKENTDFHTADVDEDGKIDIREMMRVVYLRNNLGNYEADGTSFSGYKRSGAGAGAAPPEAIIAGVGKSEDKNGGASVVIVANSADNGIGSLRDAVVNSADGDTITFDESMENIVLVSEILIDKSITIDGSGVTIISGDAQTRIFRVYNEDEDIYVTLTGIGIVDGKNASDEFGGAIYNNGENLTIENCLLNSNANTTENGQGGAVYTSGTLIVINSVFTDNTASEENDIYSTNDEVIVND